MVDTVLSLSTSSFTLGGTTALYNAVNARITDEINAKRQAISTDLTDKMDLLGAESSRLSNILGDVMTVQSSVDDSKEGIATINGNIDVMRGYVSDAMENNGQNNDYFRSEFDSQWYSINDTADSYSAEYNLIGNVDSSSGWMPNTLTYYDDTTANPVSLTGTYVGSGFVITDTDGNTWKPDGSLMQKYTSDGQPDDTYLTGMTDGVRLVSYNPDTNEISFSLKYQGDLDPIVVTGTLDRGGMQVMPSWFYDADKVVGYSGSDDSATTKALMTDDDRAYALSDLSRGQTVVDIGSAVVDGAETQVKVSTDKVNALMEENTQKQRDAYTAAGKKSEELQTEFQTQAQAVLTKLANLSSQQQMYATMFASSTSNDPFVSINV